MCIVLGDLHEHGSKKKAAISMEEKCGSHHGLWCWIFWAMVDLLVAGFTLHPPEDISQTPENGSCRHSDHLSQ